ncbi:unnamed protein product [Cylicocyclus nassatus]|uniref:Uncharacterized protein n=1 Tax=Cylicocyclus nassatus TaxID=53992 RepID=A0AA36GEQ0_CYLNA|nr:unnamed protein product [Cylicocyclus nassatus]
MHQFYVIFILPAVLSARRRDCTSHRNFTEIIKNPNWTCKGKPNGRKLHDLVLRRIGWPPYWRQHGYSEKMANVACAVAHGECPPRNLKIWNMTFGRHDLSKYKWSNFSGNFLDAYDDVAFQLIKNIYNLTHQTYWSTEAYGPGMQWWDPDVIPFKFGCANNSEKLACAAEW